MSAQRPAKAKAKIATRKQIAAMDFTAWRHAADEWKPPTNEQWFKIGGTKLPMLRVAWLLLYKSKPEIMKMVGRMDEETYSAMCDGIRDAVDFFKGCYTVASTAEARLLTASCASSAARRQKRTA